MKYKKVWEMNTEKDGKGIKVGKENEEKTQKGIISL
jgi:hypothetical protein